MLGNTLFLIPSNAQGDPLAQIDAYVENSMKKNMIPGITIGIVSNNTQIYTQGYGTAGNNGEMNASTPMMIGSISKSLTSTAILQLNESGLIDLDAPIQTYIPSFQTATPEWSSLITVRSCLHHTTGFSTIDGNNAEYDQLPLNELMARFPDISQSSKPGTKYEYSNLNYRILGYLIEIESGMDFSSYIQQNILNPLEMSNTYLNYSSAKEHQLSSGYRLWYGIPIRSEIVHSPYIAPSGGFASTVSDMCHFMIAHLNGGQYQNISILSPEMVQISHNLPKDLENTMYAMGFYNASDFGYTVIAHGGDLPNFHADMVMIPEKNIGVIVMINVNSYAGNLVGYNSIIQGIMRILLNQEIPKASSLRMLYLIIDTIIFLSLTFSIWKLVSYPKRRIKMQKKIPDQQKFREKIWLKVSFQLIGSLFLLFGIPRLIGVFIGISKLNLRVMYSIQPDMVIWLILESIIGFVRVILDLLYLSGLINKDPEADS